jgi:hypothetical protein
MMDKAAARAEAERHFLDAYRAQMAGRLDQAIAAYQKSIECLPTAEAHTDVQPQLTDQLTGRKIRTVLWPGRGRQARSGR